MLGNGQLTRCQQRKNALLEQSAAHRRVLVAEARNLRPVAAWMDLGIDVAGKARAGWNVLARLLFPWRKRKQETDGFAQKLAGGVSLARALVALWKSWR